MRGKGWDIPKVKNKITGELEEGNIIYVLGTVDGKFYRKSTGKKATKINIAWIKKNHRDVLLKLIDKKKPTISTDFKAFGLMVLNTTQAGKRTDKTQKEKIGVFENHVLPFFKDYKLEEIKTVDIELWQNKLLQKMSSSMVKKARHILGLILKKAAANDIISKNYAEYADNIEVTYKKRKPYTEHELRLLIEHSDGWFKTFMTLVFSTGMRTGEALGLHWDDIDLNNGFIHLQRSLSRGVVTEKDGNAKLEDYIKNGCKITKANNTNKTKNHDRSIPISYELRNMLAQHHMDSDSKIWVFTTAHSKPFTDSSTINKLYWKPLVAKLNIEDKTLYATRHTYASIMKNNGARDSWLKDVMGYSQTSKILDAHYFTYESKPEDANMANNFFSYIKEEKEIC